MLTRGWDTVSIVKQDRINKELQSSWSERNAHFADELPGGAGRIEGDFSCWSIVDGGGGRILRMKLPIAKGTLFLGNGLKIYLAGVSAIIEMTLSLVPQQTDLSLLQTEYKNLAKNREEMTKEKTGWILPVTLIDPEGRAGIYRNIVLDAVCRYLLSNPQQLVVVFAEINFAKRGSPDWALPKRCAYSYLDSGYLAVLSVCTDREISDLPLDVDVSGIPMGAGSFYAMSAELMLKHLILPGLLPLYQNASESSYMISGREMYNRQQLRMHEIKSGAIYYTPVVYEHANVSRITGNQIEVTYIGECDMYAGITMYWNGSVKMKAALGSGANIIFCRDGSSFSDDEDIPWYLAWILPIVGMIVQIVVAVISDDLIASIEGRSSEIKADNINTVSWCGEQTTVKAAYLSESLILEY